LIIKTSSRKVVTEALAEVHYHSVLQSITDNYVCCSHLVVTSRYYAA